MRQYELMVVMRTDMTDEGLTALLGNVQSWIEAQGGNVIRIDNWGRRHLAYPIQKQRDGYYVLFIAEMPAEAIVVLERNLRLSENVLRYLTVRMDEG
jgi:small subunit ribosomal protein S6